MSKFKEMCSGCKHDGKASNHAPCSSCNEGVPEECVYPSLYVKSVENEMPVDYYTNMIVDLVMANVQAERDACAHIAETEYAVSPNGKDSGDRIAAKIRERK